MCLAYDSLFMAFQLAVAENAALDRSSGMAGPSAMKRPPHLPVEF